MTDNGQTELAAVFLRY